MTLAVLATMLASIAMSAIARDPRFLLARDGLITGLWGLWFLASLRARRPAAYVFAIPPWSTLGYDTAVERTSGGFRASQAFSRLYMIPSAYHCLAAPDGTSVNLANFLTP